MDEEKTMAEVDDAEDPAAPLEGVEVDSAEDTDASDDGAEDNDSAATVEDEEED